MKLIKLTGSNGPVIVNLSKVRRIERMSKADKRSQVCFSGTSIVVEETVEQVMEILDRPFNQMDHKGSGE